MRDHYKFKGHGLTSMSPCPRENPSHGWNWELSQVNKSHVIVPPLLTQSAIRN